MLATLSSMSRRSACVRRYSARAGLARDLARALLVLVVPADERGEAAGLVLQVADLEHVQHAILGVSAVPNIIVAVVRMPMRCATRITSIHSALVHLALAILLRTRSVEHLGAAARQRVHARRVQALAARPRPTGPRSAPGARISSGLSACSLIGNVGFIQRNRSSYHSRCSAGLSPPCSRIWMPPAATVSSIFCAKLLAREHVALGVADRAIERAEAARRRAHVGVVDVAVDDVRDDLVADAAPCAARPRRGRGRAAAPRARAASRLRSESRPPSAAYVEQVVDRAPRAARGAARVVAGEVQLGLRQQLELGRRGAGTRAAPRARASSSSIADRVASGTPR